MLRRVERSMHFWCVPVFDELIDRAETDPRSIALGSLRALVWAETMRQLDAFRHELSKSIKVKLLKLAMCLTIASHFRKPYRR